MSVGFTNWAELGFFPLQDHEDGVPLGMRQTLAGGRIVSLTSPDETGDPAEAVHIVGTEDDMGTLGDIWPWGFWQTRDRLERGMGVWAQCWAGITVGLEGGIGPITGTGVSQPVGVLPIITSDHGVDGRMKTKTPNYPKSFSTLPEGWGVVVMPGMEETTQHLVQLSVDPRIVVSQVTGPGTASTLFVDLQPDNHPCMDGSDTPGKGGRAARSSSMMRVIALNANSAEPLGAGDYNGIAWNCALSQQEDALGLGMCWIEMRTTGGAGRRGPITPVERARPIKPNSNGSFGANANGVGEGDSPEGPTANVTGGGRHARDLDTPDDWGQFSAAARGGHGVTFMANLGGCGPLEGGFGVGDKHFIGTDLDGNPMVSAHLSANSYFVKNADQDAPLEFGGYYPKNVQDAELKVKVFLEYDPDLSHKWIKGNRSGLWRWWSTTHVCIPPVDVVGQVIDVVNVVNVVDVVDVVGVVDIVDVVGIVDVVDVVGTTIVGAPITPMRDAYGGPNRGRPNYDRPTGPTPGGRAVTPAPGGSQVEASWEAIPAQSANTVGGTSGLVSAFQIYHPTMEGFSALSFRPQQWVEGEPSTIHARGIGTDMTHCIEQTLPQVLSVHAFGGLDVASGTFEYTQEPETSRARGGTAPGGVMFTQPHLEPEDFFFDTGIDPDVILTTSYVLATPGVGFALGKPNRDGTLADNGVVIQADPAVLSRVVVSQHVAGVETDIYRFGAVTGIPFVDFLGTGAITLPVGTTAQRPSFDQLPEGQERREGRLRVNTDILPWDEGSLGRISGADTPEGYDTATGEWYQLQRYLRVVFTATSVFSYHHKFGAYPIVQVIDSSGVQVEVSVTHTDLDNVTVNVAGSLTDATLLLN